MLLYDTDAIKGIENQLQKCKHVLKGNLLEIAKRR